MASKRQRKPKRARKQLLHSARPQRRFLTVKALPAASLDEPARVVARLRHHVAIERAEIADHNSDGSFTVVARVRVNLPSRARAVGETVDGVKAEERVTIEFGPDWPRKAPRVGLRPTFPTHFAHVNHHKRGALVPPCIVEGGNNDELLHARGLDGFIDQLVHWLARAAAGQLADYGEGWEPMRRENVEGSLHFDADVLLEALPTDGSVLRARATYVFGKAWTRVEVQEPPSIPTTFTQHALDKDWHRGNTALFALRAKFENGKPPVLDKYRPDSITTLEELVEGANELGIDSGALLVAMKDFFAASLDACDGDAFEVWKAGFVIGVILGVERPAPIAGSHGGRTELLTYLVRNDAAALGKGLHDQSPVQAAMHVQRASPKLLATVSGYGAADINKRLVFIGCGSLGSKVSSHLARAGFGEQTLVDKGQMLSHTPARHALFRVSGGKAEELKKVLAGVGHDAVVAVQEDARTVLSGDAKGFSETVPVNTALVIDTTASAVVQSALVTSSALTDSGVRTARAVLYGQGRVVALLLEASGRQVRVDDLVAMLFARASQDDRLREALASGRAGLSPVFVGQNCRSLTMQMPDSAVSRGAAQVSMQLEKWLVAGLPSEGVLALGVADETDIGASWDVLPARPTVSIHAGSWNVRLLADVVERIEKDAQRWGANETGGGLLGTISHVTQTILIAGLLDAPADSVRGPTQFVLGTQGLVEKVKEASDSSLGYLGFVGTWHSHPMGGGHSKIDLRTLVGLALQARGAPSVSLVWTPTGYRAEVGQLLA